MQPKESASRKDERRAGRSRLPSWIPARGGFGLLTLGLMALALLSVFAISLSVGLGRVAFGDKRPAPSIGLPPDLVPQAKPSYRKAETVTPAWPEPVAAVPPQTAGAVVRWRSEDNIRRAAGLLLVDGDFDGAMDLLLQIEGAESRAYAVDRATHRRLLRELPRSLAREQRLLRQFWDGLSEEERAVFLGGSGFAVRDEARKAFDSFFAAPSHRLHLPHCADAMPEGVLLRFISNLHVRLVQKTGASHSLVALMLNLGFPQRSMAGVIYWEEFPNKRASYEDLAAGPSRVRKGNG